MTKIAIPLANHQLCLHFGHCEEFAFADVDMETKKIEKIEYQTPPAHEPGVMPEWMGKLGVNIIITGGIGNMAQQLLIKQNIKVVIGASPMPIEDLIKSFLNNELTLGDNVCGH
ncbi:MAG: NifB/NifX family molybdenum-iron cluster-binding protein [Lentisphaeria bacterium]